MNRVSLTALHQLRVVCIGAGTGQSCILRALRGHAQSLTAVVSVTDNGGHSGRLRVQHNIPQVGDGKQCLMALAPPSEALNHFSFRFDDGHDRAGESVGNMMLAELTMEGGIAYAFAECSKKLACQGIVLPTTEDNVHVVAELTDGSEVIGEWNIIQRNPRIPIVRVKLSETASAYEGATEAIRNADVIVVSPGSFHTGLVSALLPQGMSDAIRTSPARIIMVMNIMSQPGLTDGWNVLKHIIEIAPYLGRFPDVLIVNSGDLPDNVREYYAGIDSHPIKYCPGTSSLLPCAVVHHDLIPERFDGNGHRPGSFEKWPHIITHDPAAIRESIEHSLSLTIVDGSTVVL